MANKTMKAMRIHEHGDASVLKAEELDCPAPSYQEALVQVKGCALNHLDVWVRSGIPGVKLPLTLGCDVAGTIVELGQDVKHLKVGANVLISPGLACNACHQCLSGQENLCRFYHILGAGRDGGYAEYVNVPAINCLPIPKGLNFHEAASIPLTFLTAWHMLMTRVELKYNEVVLVVGGGSGVGSAAIQIAKLKNSLVIATAGNEEKLQKAKALGADFCINHHEANLVEEVKKLTNKRGVDVVFEHVGGAVFEDCLQILAQGGRLVTCGATIGSEAKIEITRMFMKHQAIYGSIMGTKAELVELLPLFDNSSLKPVVDKVFPLSEAKNAHQYMEAGKHFGKIILDPTL